MHLDMLVGTSVSPCPTFLLDLILNTFSKITTTHMFACRTKVQRLNLKALKKDACQLY